MLPKALSLSGIIARCLLLCMATGFITSCLSDDEPANRGIVAGDPLPQFEVTLNDGRRVSRESLRGKRVLIEFFNTGCPDCRESLPTINEVYLRLRGEEGYVVFAIAREEDEEDIERYWREHELSLPYSPQTDRRVYELFATTGIPRIFIADQEGRVGATFAPEDSPTLETLIDLLTSD